MNAKISYYEAKRRFERKKSGKNFTQINMSKGYPPVRFTCAEGKSYGLANTKGEYYVYNT